MEKSYAVISVFCKNSFLSHIKNFLTVCFSLADSCLRVIFPLFFGTNKKNWGLSVFGLLVSWRRFTLLKIHKKIQYEQWGYLELLELFGVS